MGREWSCSRGWISGEAKENWWCFSSWNSNHYQYGHLNIETQRQRGRFDESLEGCSWLPTAKLQQLSLVRSLDNIYWLNYGNVSQVIIRRHEWFFQSRPVIISLIVLKRVSRSTYHYLWPTYGLFYPLYQCSQVTCNAYFLLYNLSILTAWYKFHTGFPEYIVNLSFPQKSQTYTMVKQKHKRDTIWPGVNLQKTIWHTTALIKVDIRDKN